MQFLRVFLIRILLFDEPTGGIHVVSRINAHLFGIQGRHIGNVRIEVHVGHKRRIITAGTQSGIDIFQVFRLSDALRSQSNELSASLNNTFCLRYTALRVVRIGGCHRLNTDGIIATHIDCSYMNHRRRASLILK